MKERSVINKQTELLNGNYIKSKTKCYIRDYEYYTFIFTKNTVFILYD